MDPTLKTVLIVLLVLFLLGGIPGSLALGWGYGGGSGITLVAAVLLVVVLLRA